MDTIYRVLTFIFFICSCLISNGQTNKCGTAVDMLGNSPTPQEVESMNGIRQQINQMRINRSSDTLLIIPTVIHIIHYNGAGDISDVQVEDGLRVINEDFRRLNADTIQTDSTFIPYAADVKMEFHLAKLDPEGNPTTGIVRKDTIIIPHPEPTDPNFDNVKFASHWPEGRYFNIWLVRTIWGGSLGYAQYPGTNFTYGGPWDTWGPVIRSNTWGTIETSTEDGRTGTHEIGHCFGLYHTFRSTSVGCGSACDTTGDEVCDTPPSEIDFSCTNNNFCDNDTVGPSVYTTDVKDQKENYMSYNSCQNMFSLGQKNRMRGFFYMYDAISRLAEPSNLIATGLNPPVGQEELVQPPQIKMFPNPTGGDLQIVVPFAFTKGNYQLYDNSGRLVQNEVINDSNFTIRLEDFSSGLYHLSFVFDDSIFYTRNVVLK